MHYLKLTIYCILLSVLSLNTNIIYALDKSSDENAITVNANSADLKNSTDLGIASYNKGDFESAKQQFIQAIKNQPNNETALAYLGSAYYKLGDYQNAIKTYNEILKLNPQRKELYYDLGLSYMNSGNTKEALSAFSEVKKYFEGNSNVMFYDALARYNAGELDQTIKELKSVIEKNPDYGVDTYYYLAKAYYYKGMADEAASYFNSVIRMAGGTDWAVSSRKFIDRMESDKEQREKATEFGVYANLESDNNVTYSASKTPSDADVKTALYASFGYKPNANKNQSNFGGLKLGYSLYYLGYSTHTYNNFLGNILEISLNGSPLPDTQLTLKLNGNYYLLAGVPYLLDIPAELKYTFRVLPGNGMWTVVNAGYASDIYGVSYKNRDCSTITVGIKQYLNDFLNFGYEFRTSAASGEPATKTQDYSYDSNEINFEYIQLLPFDCSLSVNGSYLTKDFKMADSYTVTTTPTKRTDTITNVNATLAKTIFYDIGVLLKAGYYLDRSNLTSSTSGLGYGTYSSKTVSLALSKAF